MARKPPNDGITVRIRIVPAFSSLSLFVSAALFVFKVARSSFYEDVFLSKSFHKENSRVCKHDKKKEIRREATVNVH